ncbi:MAG: hypothetical protein JWN56_1289 [Sphingobacteriales bacterium]|nr:hypothetical protein [Sphingobacteriales bacterium]
MISINLHKGYEGSPEVVLREKTKSGQTVFELHLLDFHFDEILSNIPLGQYHEDSVMYNYFRVEGWHDEEWECTRVKEFLAQLTELDDRINPKDITVHDALKRICESSLKNNNKLFIELE